MTSTVVPATAITPSVITTLNAAQKEALAAVDAGCNVFLTGVAGTGKTFTTREIIKRIQERYDEQPTVPLAVTSSTGITAIQFETGQTLHSFAGLGLAQDSMDFIRLKALKSRKLRAIWQGIEHLIIDEVSMVDPIYLEKLDMVARVARKNPHQVFGGIQVILIGDFAQLPFVVKGASNQRPPFLFERPLWEQMKLRVICLREVFRQASDPHFIQLLERVRIGKISDEDREILTARVAAPLKSFTDRGILPTHLFAINHNVDEHNARELAKLPVKEFPAQRYRVQSGVVLAGDADEEGDSLLITKKQEFLKKNCNAVEDLELKIGAQVMLLCNYALQARLMNGSRGVVVGFQEGLPVVQFEHMKVLVRKWRWRQFLRDGGSSSSSHVYLEQVPLRLAWALTIHKSQGQSLDCVRLCLDAKTVRDDNMAYVALSRVRSLEGLSLENFDSRCIRSNAKVTAFYEKLVPVGEEAVDPEDDPEETVANHQ